MEPVGAVAIAIDGRQTIALFLRHKDENLRRLVARLDTATAGATIDALYIGEVNAPHR